MVSLSPVIIRHSLAASLSVKRRDTISSGFKRNRISSCSRPELRTPPPIQLEAKSTCQLYIFIEMKKKEKKQNKKNLKWFMETSLRGLSLLLMASHLQQACAFILNGSMWGDVHPGHHLVTAVKGKQKRRKKLLHSEYRGYFLRTPWKCTMSLTMVQLQSHKIQSPKTLRSYPLAAVCMIMWKSVWFPRQRWHLSMAPAQKHCNIYLIGWTEI